MSSGSILRLWKIQNHLPPKRAIANEKQTVLWMVTVFLNTLFTKHLLAQLLIYIAMILMKILSKNITITINALSEVNFVERILNYSSIYRNWKRERYQLFYWLGYCYEIAEMFVDLENVVDAFERRPLLQVQILIFFSINVMRLLRRHRNKSILKCFEDRSDNLYYSVYVNIPVFLFSRYKYWRIPSNNWRHQSQCHVICCC